MCTRAQSHLADGTLPNVSVTFQGTTLVTHLAQPECRPRVSFALRSGVCMARVPSTGNNHSAPTTASYDGTERMANTNNDRQPASDHPGRPRAGVQLRQGGCDGVKGRHVLVSPGVTQRSKPWVG